ncbi:MAG TPA: PPOX class F420-dependent oxidoreductase [Myxococcota bacterium]|nr:PPOX class F420-dependent oxidoreductase [Myxococcota bacterium]
MSRPFDPARETYVSLATFRRDGREVRTAVWIAGAGGKLYVYTNGTSWKVKRLRNDPRVRLAACDARGKLRAPEAWLDGRGRVEQDPARMQTGIDAVAAKYGWQARLLYLGARIGGRWKDRTILEIELA